ncbi:unnamed protein product [Prorocentrum cordatum]|uniref:Uncharacterized protein n=1 Tax=Prorocentrum cordatum TaxID=2364126 RepID=A0ABN9R8P5_9DINO|nr:unnamed protein product [Polarella glacialis]
MTLRLQAWDLKLAGSPIWATCHPTIFKQPRARARGPACSQSVKDAIWRPEEGRLLGRRRTKRARGPNMGRNDCRLSGSRLHLAALSLGLRARCACVSAEPNTICFARDAWDESGSRGGHERCEFDASEAFASVARTRPSLRRPRLPRPVAPPSAACWEREKGPLPGLLGHRHE